MTTTQSSFPRRRKSMERPGRRSAIRAAARWIPACAGMTALVTGLALSAAAAPKTSSGAYDLPYIGTVEHYPAKYEDTVVQVARANDLGYIELLAANPGMDPWLPGRDKTMTLPKMHILPDAPHNGVVINLPEMRIFYYAHPGAKPQTFPIGIGRAGLTSLAEDRARVWDWRPARCAPLSSGSRRSTGPITRSSRW